MDNDKPHIVDDNSPIIIGDSGTQLENPHHRLALPSTYIFIRSSTFHFGDVISITKKNEKVSQVGSHGHTKTRNGDWSLDINDGDITISSDNTTVDIDIDDSYDFDLMPDPSDATKMDLIVSGIALGSAVLSPDNVDLIAQYPKTAIEIDYKP